MLRGEVQVVMGVLEAEEVRAGTIMVETTPVMEVEVDLVVMEVEEVVEAPTEVLMTIQVATEEMAALVARVVMVGTITEETTVEMVVQEAPVERVGMVVQEVQTMELATQILVVMVVMAAKEAVGATEGTITAETTPATVEMVEMAVMAVTVAKGASTIRTRTRTQTRTQIQTQIQIQIPIPIQTPTQIQIRIQTPTPTQAPAEPATPSRASTNATSPPRVSTPAAASTVLAVPATNPATTTISASTCPTTNSWSLSPRARPVIRCVTTRMGMGRSFARRFRSCLWGSALLEGTCGGICMSRVSFIEHGELTFFGACGCSWKSGCLSVALYQSTFFSRIFLLDQQLSLQHLYICATKLPVSFHIVVLSPKDVDLNLYPSHLSSSAT